MPTVFQRLNKAFGGNTSVPTPTSTNYTRNVHSYAGLGSNDVIYSTRSKEDYTQKLAQLRQERLLAKQWKRAQYETQNNALANMTEVQMMYREADMMDLFPEIGAALDIYMEEACLAGNTKIKLLSGVEKTIKELFDEDYTNFWVYAVDENGQCAPTLIERVINKGNKQIYEITLDDGSIIKCTGDHKWLLSDNTWCEAKDLKFGSSLMSISSKLNYLGYEQIKSTVEPKYRLTHRVVAESVLYDDKLKLSENNKPFQQIVIHHKSFNKLNNDPSQLQYMYWNDHQKLHTDLNSERWNDKEYSDKMRHIFSDTAKKTWSDTKKAKETKRKMSESHLKYYSKLTKEELLARGLKGKRNGMYGVHRYGKLNPNYNENLIHFEDINKTDYIYQTLTHENDSINHNMKYFNMSREECLRSNRILLNEYGCERVSSLKYVIDGFCTLNDIKNACYNGYTTIALVAKNLGYSESCVRKCLKQNGVTFESVILNVAKSIVQKNQNITKIELAKTLKTNKRFITDMCTHNGYKDYEDFINSCYNHRVVSVKEAKYKENVYDLYNSSVNNCFGVKCSSGLIISHNCYTKPDGMMINVTSKSERIKSILEDLIYNRLSSNIMFPMITRSTVKYGNTFMLLNVTEDNGVIGWKQLPVYEMQRFENGMDNPYSSGFANVANIDVDSPDSTKFVWVGKNEFTPYRNWQIAHFRLLYDSLYLPYGVSALNKARRHWRMLSMMEDMMLMYRLERSVERRIYKVNVGGIDEQDVPAFMDEVANQFKRTPIIDPLTGQLDLRRNIMSQMDDYFLPIRDANDPTSIDNLAAGNNLTAMDDIKFVQNKLCTALRVPKSFLNFEDTTGDGKNLSLLDVRFTKTVNRVQQMMLMELTKVCIIHLYLLGFEDDLTNFSLTMNNPSSQAEMMELDNLSKKIEMAKSAVADPGGGLPLYSVTRAQKEILGWSDKQISDNLEELRLEKALAAELEKTASIIKRTGLFDKVDNLYGEPGAEYGNNAGGQGQEDGMGGGAPGGGMAGGLDMGDDMGDDMGGEMPGAEGDMSMDDAAASEGADGGADNASEPLNEVFFNRLMQKTIKDKKELKQNLMEKTKHYQDLLISKINESKIKEEKELNVPLYAKNFLINEELNSIANGLNKHINEKK